MNERHAKPPSRRFVIIGSLVAAGIIGVFVLAPCTVRDLNSRAMVGRDISRWRHVDAAIRIYHMEHGAYPASLSAPDFQPYIDEAVAAFLREGRLSYHLPAADSPPTFIIVHMITPRGDFSSQLDGTPLYPNFK